MVHTDILGHELIKKSKVTLGRNSQNYGIFCFNQYNLQDLNVLSNMTKYGEGARSDHSFMVLMLGAKDTHFVEWASEKWDHRCKAMTKSLFPGARISLYLVVFPTSRKETKKICEVAQITDFQRAASGIPPPKSEIYFYIPHKRSSSSFPRFP